MTGLLERRGDDRRLAQAQGLPLTPASDIYTLGVVLFELLAAGALPSVGAPEATEELHSLHRQRKIGLMLESFDATWLEDVWLVVAATDDRSLNRRIAAASGTRVEQGEPLQVLRYRPGQQYRNHYDAIAGMDNQRALTMLVYLNDAYQGGETRFVRTGLAVRGRKDPLRRLRVRAHDEAGGRALQPPTCGDPVDLAQRVQPRLPDDGRPQPALRADLQAAGEAAFHAGGTGACTLPARRTMMPA